MKYGNMENQKSYLNHTARGLVGFDEKGPSYINFPLVFCFFSSIGKTPAANCVFSVISPPFLARVLFFFSGHER